MFALSSRRWDAPPSRQAAGLLDLWRAPLSVIAGWVLLAAFVFFLEANFLPGDIEDFGFDWQIMLRLSLCACCGLYGLAHALATLPLFFRVPGVFVMLMACWALACSPFAFDRRFAAAAAITLICVALFAVAIATQLSTWQITSAVLTGTLSFLAACWIAHYAFPDLSDAQAITFESVEEGRFAGLSHPNGTGRTAVLTVGLLVMVGLRGWAPRVIVAALCAFCLITIVLTGSRTSLLCLGVVALLASRYALPRILWLGLMCLLLAGLFVGMVTLAAGLANPNWLQLSQSVSRTGDADEIMTMTGRTELWSFAWRRVWESPLFGYGHGCQRHALSVGHDWEAGHAHQLFLNTALGLGFPGAALLALMSLFLLYGMLARPSMFPDVICATVLAVGAVESTLLAPIPETATLLWMMALVWRQTDTELASEWRAATADDAPALARSAGAT